MPAKLKAWLKAKLGFGGPVPYKTLVEEEVEVEPVVPYNCDYCDYRSPTQKGLRSHRITVHRIGVGLKRTLDSHGRPLAYFERCTSVAVWSASLVTSATAWIPSSVLKALHFNGCLDQRFGHISRCLDTIKCTYSAVWSTSLVTSVNAWTPSSVLKALHFSGCLDQRFGHISRCLDTIKCTYNAALQWLFGLQV
ncbi:uncharacterized protein TNCT_565361 [Trichonephila clavata]|uniref:C2H2-type domain-containing protein n=1 Tax=Trichonephila clavata TaxID=2740835 RepID=A0A8X6HSG0_TRICU|nr:uncharacterized protein TNCT_565361 [Trichonephila clavata]